MNNIEKEIEETENTIDILIFAGDLWKGIKKFGWLVVLLAVLSSGLSCLRAHREYYPNYTAAATFTVNLNSDTDSGIYEDSLKAAQMSKTFPYIITSGVLKNIIANDLGLPYISESISAENVEDTNLFTLKVNSGDPKKAYDVLQSVIKNYPKVAETVVGSTQLSMLDETGVPTEPDNRLNYKASAKKGALPGGFIGIAVILIYVFTRKTVHKANELTEITNLKHLGTLPNVKFKKRGNQFDNIVSLLNEKVSQVYRENIYKIRTRIEKAAGNDNLKTILVTSTIQGEGKSTFAFNLALALAEEGRKVTLVDCDLHHPSIKDMLKLKEETAGLEMVLSDKAELSDVLKYYEKMNISVIAGSKPAENASEIIGSLKMRDILNELKETSDYVILDTPPSVILSDALDLVKFADGVVFMVKQDYAKVSQILNGLEHISDNSNIKMVGYIFNGVKAGISGYGYGYGYGSYGYGRYGRYGRYGSYGRNGKEESPELTMK